MTSFQQTPSTRGAFAPPPLQSPTHESNVMAQQKALQVKVAQPILPYFRPKRSKRAARGHSLEAVSGMLATDIL
jgi:hypothetical protein